MHLRLHCCAPAPRSETCHRPCRLWRRSGKLGRLVAAATSEGPNRRFDVRLSFFLTLSLSLSFAFWCFSVSSHSLHLLISVLCILSLSRLILSSRRRAEGLRHLPHMGKAEVRPGWTDMAFSDSLTSSVFLRRCRHKRLSRGWVLCPCPMRCPPVESLAHLVTIRNPLMAREGHHSAVLVLQMEVPREPSGFTCKRRDRSVKILWSCCSC